MPTFRTQFDNRPRFTVSSGSREKTLYGGRYDEDGRLILVETGKEDLYGYIQSHRDSVDLNKLLARFAQGETDVLSRRQGVYGDFTGLPGSYAEYLNKVNSGKEYFYQLPLDTRRKFGNSFEQWMASMDDSDFADKMGWNVKETTPIETVVESKIQEAKTE